jgi:microcystin-dependent protein
MGQTPNRSLPYPELGDSADVPRDIKALADALDAQSVIPAGVIQMWPDAAAPNGWLLCQGQPVPAASNPGLAAIFGTSGGNVILPDLRGRALIGAAPVNVPASGDPARALRSSGGAATVALQATNVPKLETAALIQQRSGGLKAGAFNNYQTQAGYNAVDGWDNGAARSVNGLGGVALTGAAHENMSPYYAINFIIKAG